MKSSLDMRENAGILWLTLNRPAKRNALDAGLVEELTAAFQAAAHQDSVRVVVLTGAGADFCAGADLSELEKVSSQGPEASLADASRLGRLFVLMRECPKPVLAAVRGRALAGGCGLATAADLVLAEEGAQFGYPEVNLGFVPAMVMAILRRKVGESRAFALAAGGKRISAREARDLGLVHQIWADHEFEKGVEDFAREWAGLPPGAVTLTKRLLYGLDGSSFHDAIDRGAEVNVLARSTEACRAGVRAFLERVRTQG